MREIIKRLCLGLATGVGVGYLPGAPGTCGTLLAVAIYYFLPKDPVKYLLFLLMITLAGVYASSQAAKHFRKPDPSQVVIDEMAGFWLTMWTLPPTWLNITWGFILFRFFDIVKPFPLKQAEKIKGGTGIMLDDLLAGIYSLGLLKLYHLGRIFLQK
ncbi:MAG: phosphatidylglycerophosphatase A [Candidatus Desulfofervidaceae bacterium]|nr:phosphatidylglycerophosphatase A [Candidatus Desulfofervidaceae bacterium]MDL1969477.1 phosphatidylglycerophosphatase A [Candidatus Desulfofervidaceae bacterium]